MIEVAITSPDRVLWPGTGTTKRDLVDYYLAVAPVLLPHLAGRALTLWRFPEGVRGRGFWQNECRGAPPWLRTATLRGQKFCVVESAAALKWLANLSTIELHPFLGRADEPSRPTAMVLDLDPGPPAGLEECCAVALRVREELASTGLRSFPKTSGSAGLHVVVPLNTRITFEETKAFSRALAERLAAEAPDRVVAAAGRSERRGKVLVDWLQNDETRTTVAPYSLRATPAPSASTPLAWEEVERGGGRFGPAQVRTRIERSGDLHGPVLDLEQELPSR